MKIIWMAYDKNNYTGGPIVNTTRVLPMLKERGHEVYAIIGHDGTSHPSTEILEANGVKCFTYKHTFTIVDVKLILQIVSSINPDIFVSNISTQGALAGRWIKEWGIPVIHTNRGDNQLNNGTSQFFFKGPKKWRLNALVSVNQFLLDQLNVNGESEPDFITKVIPSGVPISNFKAKQDTENGRIGIVYAGRIVQKQKRVVEIINAFIALAKQNSSLDFSLIGDGDINFVAELKAIVKGAKLQDRILFKGKLERDLYKKELSNNQILVLLSDFEGISGSVMDGMECGLVPIILDINGMDELIKHMENGIIIKDRENALYKAVDLLANDNEFRERLSERAIETISKDYSLAKTVDLWEELFLELKPYFKGDKKNVIPRFLTLPRNSSLLIEHIAKPNLISRIIRRIKRL